MLKSKNKLIYYILCLYIVLTPIIPYGFSLNIIPKLHKIPGAGDCMLVLLIIAVIIAIIREKREYLKYIKDFASDLMGISFFVLLAIMLFSTLYATYKWMAVQESLRFLSFILLYFIVKYNVDKIRVRGIIACYMLTFTLINIYSIFQKFTGYGLLKGYSMITSSTLRINGTFDNPNALAAFLILGAFPVVMMIIKSKKKYVKALYSILFIVTLCNIYFTGSRNSFLALVVGGLVISILYSWYFLIGIGGIGVVSLLIQPVRGRIFAIFDTSLNESRVQLWRTALKMIQNHPIFGVGNGNFVGLYDTYVKKYKYLAYENYSHYPTHNSFLKIESELGIIGGLSFVSIIIHSLIKIKNVISKIKDKDINLFYIGFLASAVAFICMNLIDNLFFVPQVVAYFWIFLAAADGLLFRERVR